jgi:hypothetical protein
MLGKRAGLERLRFRRRIRHARRGVVSVVGSLLSLLVFFTLFGIFLTQFLPIWMSENEQGLTSQTVTSLGQLKTDIDEQAVTGGPSTIGTQFAMESGNIPLLAAPTVGTLNFVPSSPGIYASAWVTPAPGGTTVTGGVPNTHLAQNTSLGILTMSLPNRYFSPEFFSYENDAVLQTQSGGQSFVAFAPTLSIQPSPTGGVSVIDSIVQLVGAAASGSSGAPQDVYSHYVTNTTFTSSNGSARGVNATIVEGTLYPCAWESFFNRTIQAYLSQGFSFASGGTPTITPTPPANCPSTTPSNPTYVKLQFTHLYSFELVFAEVRLDVGVGVA